MGRGARCSQGGLRLVRRLRGSEARDEAPVVHGEACGSFGGSEARDEAPVVHREACGSFGGSEAQRHRTRRPLFTGRPAARSEAQRHGTRRPLFTGRIRLQQQGVIITQNGGMDEALRGALWGEQLSAGRGSS